MTDFAWQYGPWALVTGAAQGVGRAFAEEALARGLGVVLVDRNPEVATVATALEGDARAVVVDLRDPSWLEVVDDVVADLDVGLAVANAGVSYVGRFLDMSDDECDALLAVNARATVELARWALPPMIERGRGALVVTSSGSALVGTGGVALYSATKAFVLNLAEAVGWELRDTGVVAQAIVAPAMDTPAFRGHHPDPTRMATPIVDPRDVVADALDRLGETSCVLGDEGLELLASLDRREAVDLVSSTTTGMYPRVF